MQVFSGRVEKHMHFILKELSDCFYPPRCPVCDEILAPGKLICAQCEKEACPVAEPTCRKCGKPIEDTRGEYCSDCVKRSHAYRQGKAVFVYKTGLKKSLYRFKYSNRREYVSFYAKRAAEIHGDWIYRKKIEVIIPIPMYIGKKRRRGYNQAEVFARALGRQLGIPVDAGLVKRVRNTTPQKELNHAERQRNLKKAFHLAQNIVKYKQVLLVDDIYTTGSTMDAVSAVLQDAGVGDIYYLCISIGAGF